MSLLQPFFLPSDAGPLFCIYHRPDRDVELRGNVLCVPPFNEEMNRCRSMITLQAQAFAEAGYGTLLVDLPGTGDSHGDHGDATWESWQAAVLCGHLWLSARGGCAALWGVRLGVALALSALMGRQDAPRLLVAWQPVTDGKTHLTQFLRVRIAAQLEGGPAQKETTSLMRQQFAQGQPVEVAGYEINPRLASSLDELRLQDLRPAPGTSVLWLEQQRETENPGEAGNPALAASSQRVVDDWTAHDVDVSVQSFRGPAFWQLYERAVAPEIIARSREWILGKALATGRHD